MKNRIKEFRENLGLSQEELGNLVNSTSQQIGRLEKGQRKLTQEWIEKLSTALKVKPTDLLPIEWIIDKSPITTIPKIGYVQAGQWNEACQLPEDEWEAIPYPITENYKGKNIFALGVKGDSMNLVYTPDKTTLICCPIEEWIDINGKENIEGKYIIAYRKSPDGLYEATVKKFTKIDENTIILVSESTNSEIKPIIIHPDKNEYEIAAVVIGDMRMY